MEDRVWCHAWEIFVGLQWPRWVSSLNSRTWKSRPVPRCTQPSFMQWKVPPDNCLVVQQYKCCQISLIQPPFIFHVSVSTKTETATSSKAAVYGVWNSRFLFLIFTPVEIYQLNSASSTYCILKSLIRFALDMPVAVNYISLELFSCINSNRHWNRLPRQQALFHPHIDSESLFF